MYTYNVSTFTNGYNERKLKFELEEQIEKVASVYKNKNDISQLLVDFDTTLTTAEETTLTNIVSNHTFVSGTLDTYNNQCIKQNSSCPDKCAIQLKATNASSGIYMSCGDEGVCINAQTILTTAAILCDKSDHDLGDADVNLTEEDTLKILFGSPTSPRTLTMPTAFNKKNMTTHLYNVVIINQGSANYTVSHTNTIGNMVISSNTTGNFLLSKTKLYRL